MSELSPRELDVILRSDLGYFAERCFYQLNPQAAFLTNWHIEVIAAKLAAVREGKIQRLIINVLLSFAQFEREVIGERIRDKIAASDGWRSALRLSGAGPQARDP